MAMKSIFGQTSNELTHFAKSIGYSQRAIELFFGRLYRQSKSSQFGSLDSQLSNKLIDLIQRNFDHDLPEVVKVQKSIDGTVKLLIEFQDGQQVESVLLPFWKKYGLCVSSQVGCAMNCSFCHTATQGLKRNLKASEIVMQIMVAKRFLQQNTIDYNADLPLTNIVFMGQGEPLHNFDEVKKAIDIITDRYGLGIGKRSITVSTSGYLPGLKRFHELGVNLALSLHSVKENFRSELIPINRAYPLATVIAEMDKIKLRKRQLIEYEYLLIKNLNDTKEDIELLHQLLASRSHVINIIPFNPFPGSKYQRPDSSSISYFKNALVDKGLRVMVRQTKGEDILAACGQLKS